jgi:hypothetical protein
MEDHHWGGQGWNSAVEPQEEVLELDRDISPIIGVTDI